MPHIIVKLQAGRTDAMKQDLADALVRAAMEVIGASEDSLSVVIEDVARDDWMDAVFYPDIRGNRDRLFKKPGYKEP